MNCLNMVEDIETTVSTKTEGEVPVILLLSDLHFGSDESCQGEIDQNTVLGSLITFLTQVDPLWKPTIVCITGDIGYYGSEQDYAAAKDWLDKLLGAVDLSYNRVIACPGNHDSDWSKARAMVRPDPDKDTVADRVLSIGCFQQYEKPFSAYIKFCKDCGLEPFELHNQKSYLMGQRTVNNVRFVSCNSAWFSQDNNDRGNLWLGLPLLRAMNLPLRSSSEAPVIALMHHPPYYLTDSDVSNPPLRPGALRFLAQRSHLLLTGHSHDMPGNPDTVSFALHIKAGAAYGGIRYPNCFCICRIENDGFNYQYFKTEPGSPSELWRPCDEPCLIKFPWTLQEASTEQTVMQIGAVKSSRKKVDGKIHAVGDCRMRVQEKIAQIKEHLDHFEYDRTFEAANQLKDFVKTNRSQIPDELLFEAYIFLGEIAITKANREHFVHGKTKDFSKAEYFIKKARDVWTK